MSCPASGRCMPSGSPPTVACSAPSPRPGRSSIWAFPRAWCNGYRPKCPQLHDGLAGRGNPAGDRARRLVGPGAGLGGHRAGRRWRDSRPHRPPPTAGGCGPGRAGSWPGARRTSRRLAAAVAAGACRCGADGDRNRCRRRAGPATNAPGRGCCPRGGRGAAVSRGSGAGLRSAGVGAAERAGGGQRGCSFPQARGLRTPSSDTPTPGRGRWTTPRSGSSRPVRLRIPRRCCACGATSMPAFAPPCPSPMRRCSRPCSWAFVNGCPTSCGTTFSPPA